MIKFTLLALALVGTFFCSSLWAEETKAPTAQEMQERAEKAIKARGAIEILDTRLGVEETGRRTGLTFSQARTEDARRTAAMAGDVDGFVASVVAWPFNAVSTTAYSLADETRPQADRAYYKARKSGVESIEKEYDLLPAPETK